MLHRWPEDRPTAEEMVDHPWFLAADASQMSGDLSEAARVLKSWKSRKRLKGGVKALMAAKRLSIFGAAK